jgi:hypothetical protein
VFFDYVRQGTQAKGQYRVHYPMFARYSRTDVDTVFGIRTTICPSIGSTRVGVFVWGYQRSIGRRGIESSIEPGDKQAFGYTIDRISMAACSHWDSYPEVDTSQQDIGEG